MQYQYDEYFQILNQRDKFPNIYLDTAMCLVDHDLFPQRFQEENEKRKAPKTKSNWSKGIQDSPGLCRYLLLKKLLIILLEIRLIIQTRKTSNMILRLTLKTVELKVRK